MNFVKNTIFTLATLWAFASAAPSFAGTDTDSTIGAGGYDLTSYRTQEKPQRGNGHHVAVLDGVSYLFATDENKKAFEENPAKFLPEFGGYCAFGVSVNKKFVADPEQFDVIDGKLYLNLDAKVRSIWLQNVSGRISDANSNWKKISHKKPQEL